MWNIPAIAPDNKSLPGNASKLELKYFEIILFFVTAIVHAVVVGVMVFKATLNNIPVISWRSVLLVEKTTDLPQVAGKLYHIMLY